MPYIEEEDRIDINTQMDEATPEKWVDGELNYAITTLCDDFLGDAPRYSNYNTVIGVLECVKLEMYRRQVAPYEDLKCVMNGDVYRKRG